MQVLTGLNLLARWRSDAGSRWVQEWWGRSIARADGRQWWVAERAGGFVSDQWADARHAARFAIKSMGLSKRVPLSTVERAGRLFMLALEGGTYRSDGSDPKNYVLGRKSEYTQASCLYVACRLDKTHHMLIDFADAISVSKKREQAGLDGRG